MSGFSRRQALATGLAATMAPALALGAARPKVIVVGGGAGGATAARYLAQDGALDVTLVEPTRKYYTPFFSNFYLAGLRDLESLGHDYGALTVRFGVNVIHDRIAAIDREKRVAVLTDGARLSYDRLILSPGVDFVDGSPPGWSAAVQHQMPHAYKTAGSQTQLLKAQIEAMRPGGVFVMIAPPAPYRCPPGPYERVSLVAYALSRRNPTAKIVIVDPKTSFTKMTLFQEAWTRLYPGVIDWVSADMATLTELRPEALEVLLDGEALKADVCNVIPAMQAGYVARAAELTDASGWAPIESETMRSRMDAHIHVIGDSCANGDMPKSGFAANSQAKACAQAVRAALIGAKTYPPLFTSTCWSTLAPDEAIKVGASYRAEPEKIAWVAGYVSDVDEDPETRRRTYAQSQDWYQGITRDMFG